MDLNEIICTTTFRQGDPNNPIDKTRTEVFLDMAREMGSVGLSLITVYTETHDRVLDTIRRLGVIIVKQQSVSMGNIRREALIAALSHFPRARYLCWLEPEKPNLVQFIVPMARQMEQEQSVLGIFNRADMASYPPEQAYYYLFCRAVATHLVGFDVDYAFGPMIVTRSAIPYFLKYQGEYGDKWDSIFVPRLRIIKDGLTVSVLPIYFQNDRRMTQVEVGNPTIILKRLEQLNIVIPSLIAEWQQLNAI